MKQHILTLISSILGVQFAFIKYTTKETIYKTAETSLYKLNIGANIENLYKSDISTLENLTLRQIKENPKFANFDPEIIAIAKQEIYESLLESIKYGIGNNSKNTKQNYYTYINKNVKYNVNDNSEIIIYFNGLCEDKQVLLPATIKKVKNSAQKTIVKNLLKYEYLKISKIREFIINENQIKSINANKQQLVIETF